VAALDRARAAQLLGVDITASPEQVRDAFRHRAWQLHPDTGTGDATAMAELNAAYEVLSARSQPDWEFATTMPTEQAAPWDDPPEGADHPYATDSSLLRWLVVALAIAGVVMTVVVFIAAIGYDWSLSP
jgi:hypothetical protein